MFVGRIDTQLLKRIDLLRFKSKQIQHANFPGRHMHHVIIIAQYVIEFGHNPNKEPVVSTTWTHTTRQKGSMVEWVSV